MMTGEYGSLLRILAESWSRDGAPVSARTSGLIRTLVERLRNTSGAEDFRRSGNELFELLNRLLPIDHPARPPLSRISRGAVAAESLGEAAEALLAALEADAPDELGTEELFFWSERDLLSAPARTLAEMDPDVEPEDPGLLRLEEWDGSEQWPRFQFDSAGRPIPVVRSINLLLDAEGDPWGVAGWWMSGNTWLAGRSPADLVGEDQHDLLFTLAQAVVEGD